MGKPNSEITSRSRYPQRAIKKPHARCLGRYAFRTCTGFAVVNAAQGTIPVTPTTGKANTRRALHADVNQTGETGEANAHLTEFCNN